MGQDPLPAAWLLEAALGSPGKTALLTPNGRYDYQGLLSQAATLSGVLRAQGLHAGATVAVQSRDPVHLALMLYTALLADFTLLPLDPGLPDSDRRGLLAQARADKVLDGPGVQDLLAQTSDTKGAVVMPAPPGGGEPTALHLLNKVNGILRDEQGFGMSLRKNIYPSIVNQVGRISAFCASGGIARCAKGTYRAYCKADCRYYGRSLPGYLVGQAPVNASKRLGGVGTSSGATTGVAAPSPRGHLRLLIASSGSTAAPKLIALADRQLAASVMAVNACLGVSSASVWLACLPLVHIGGLAVLLRCARAAAGVVLHRGFDAGAVMDDLRRRRVTHISLVPTMLVRLLETGIAPPVGLEVALLGGAPLSRSLARRALALGWPLWVSYGMTETASMLAVRRLDEADVEGDALLSVGPPLAGYRLRVVDERGRVTSGEGVIEVCGAAVAASGWLTTGDRGRVDADGVLSVSGRADQVINTGGEKVQPERVEDALSGCPGILRVAVTGRPDPLWGERVVAIYCGAVDVSTVVGWCRRHLSGALRPREVRRVAALPLTANGKLDRVALRSGACCQGDR